MNSFFAMLYDWFIYHDLFSIELFDLGSYFHLGLIILSVSVLIMAIFYYAWNPTYGRWYHWLLMIVVSALIAAGISYAYLTETLIAYTSNSQYPDTESFILNMALVTALYTFLCSAISSFIIRIGSSKNKANPFALRLR